MRSSTKSLGEDVRGVGPGDRRRLRGTTRVVLGRELCAVAAFGVDCEAMAAGRSRSLKRGPCGIRGHQNILPSAAAPRFNPRRESEHRQAGPVFALALAAADAAWKRSIRMMQFGPGGIMRISTRTIVSELGHPVRFLDGRAMRRRVRSDQPFGDSRACSGHRASRPTAIMEIDWSEVPSLCVGARRPVNLGEAHA